MLPSYIDELNNFINELINRPEFDVMVSELKKKLRNSKHPYVWKRIIFPDMKTSLPLELKSNWIFVLKENVPSESHYHPNSTQHMAILEGTGKAIIGNQSLVLENYDPNKKESIYVINENQPHEFFPVNEDIVVLSFHTCNAEDLIEINLKEGTERKYI